MSVRPWAFAFTKPMTLLMDLGPGELRREVGLQHHRFDGLLRNQVGASAGCELGDGLAPLFDHLVDDREHLAVIERDALVHLALLDGGQQQADRREPLLISGSHRRLHVLGDAFLERHGAGESVYRELRMPSRETRFMWRLMAAAFLRLRSCVGFS